MLSHAMCGTEYTDSNYSQTSEQRTLWEQYKFKLFVLCREVVLFSEVKNVLEP